VSEERLLIDSSHELGIPLSAAAAMRLLQLLDELLHWNRAYSLTSIDKREEMLTRHLLDSLSVAPFLQGRCIADAGTGAGFPGLPLAIACPELSFKLIDSNQKKISFVNHAVRALELHNVEAVHARVEALSPTILPADTIVARAFAPLGRLLERIAPLAGASTRVLAMKAQLSDAELASVGATWRVDAVHRVSVPGLDEARCIVAVRHR